MKKKILIVINSANGGGAEKALLDILKNIDTKIYSINLVLLNEAGIYLEEFKQNSDSIEFVVKKSNKIVKIPYLGKVINILLIKLFCMQYIKKIKDNYDIEIAFLEGFSTEYISNRKNESLKIAWIHTNLLKFKMPIWINKNTYNKFDKIICVSEEAKKSLLILNKNLKNIEIINNLILKEKILQKSKLVERKIKSEKVLIIAAGRLNEAKGFDTLLKAFSEVLKLGYDYELKILGEGEERKKLEKIINDNNLTQNVELLGFKENPYSYIKQADIFIMTSRYEGYPLILCEAITLKLPVISTKCSGAIEILKNGKYGVMVEIDNIEQIKNSIIMLGEDKKIIEKYKKLSEENSTYFVKETIVDKINKLFK